MSNALAIASVTRVLQDLLHSGLVSSGISGAVGGTITVTALPPNRILGESGQATETTQLNLFLHQVTPNSAWNNRDLPTRDGRFDRVADPMLALNLGYLLTAYTETELQGEILLGHGMQLLHENAVLSRTFIRNILANPPGGGLGSAALQALMNSDLADQPELIRIRPQPLSMDDMSKLWTAFQTQYRITAAYDVSVVLIERQRPKRTPLPVLSRGERNPETGRDAGIAVQPSLIPPVPTLGEIVPERRIAARLGDRVTLRGHHLAGEAMATEFVEERSQSVLLLPASLQADGSLGVDLPDPPSLAGPPPPPPPASSPLNPANWRIGIWRTAAVIETAGEISRTNALPLVLAPLVQQISANLVAAVTTFTVTVSPPVRRGQTAALIVGTRSLGAAAFAGAATTTLSFSGGGFTAGTTFPVRLRVDGIDSLLVDPTVTPPVFDPTQEVAIA
ncbi:hypothetical protein Sa4125_22780 [Aureimonas sp. SA4125]|uniref:DUF4255 domain-containing protein n=1 Tax=Aureimonas sp. SA4125 TaxID=2826993 RepID=UPI001CC74BA5|nr:DUF4255 domain-containing protein [Aureimonas sp. SA4125]BDA84736.1 hypothetical protein Sa4125_22780 [Aureimonas sp. SA4125]